MARYQVTRPPFGAGELGPFLGREAVEAHLEIHGHHADGLNRTLESIGGASHPAHISSILADLASVPEDARGDIAFYGGGFDNHAIFWESVIPGGGDPGRLTADMAEVYFGGMDGLARAFEEAASGLQGSGWCWLAFEPSYRRLVVTATPNEESPRSRRLVPLLGLDLWEHSYYADYASDRASYVREWWKVANWDHAESKLAAQD